MDTVEVTAGASLTGKDIRLQRTTVVSGKVTATTGGGVADVAVKLFRADDESGDPVFTGYSMSDGAFTIPDVPSGRYLVQFDAADTIYMSQWHSGASTREAATAIVVTGGVPVSVSAALVAGARISGVVRDGSGQPLAGVQVTARDRQRGELGWALSNDDGSFTVPRLLAGMYTLEFSAEGHVSRSYGQTSPTTPVAYFQVADSAALTGKDMVLPLGGTVSGTVSVADDNPNAVVYVDVMDPAGHLQGYYGQPGAYTVTGVDSGPHTVQFGASDDAGGIHYGDRWWRAASTAEAADPVDVTLGQETAGIDMTLAPTTSPPTGAQITGTVVAASGAPLPNLHVQARCSAGDQMLYPAALTDAAGHYAIDGAEGTCWVEISDPAEVYVTTTVRTAAGQDFEVQGQRVDLGTTSVVKGAVLAGRVTAAGAGVADVRVYAVPADHDAWVESGTLFATTDETGAFRIGALPGDVYTLRYVPPASAGLAPQYLGGAVLRSQADYLTVPAGTSRTGLDADLSRIGSISGRVTGTGGVGVAGVRVSAVERTGERSESVETDTAGNYTIGGLPTGSYTLEFDGRLVGYSGLWWQNAADIDTAAYLSLTSGAALSGKSVQLTEMAVISGRVTAPDGSPIAGATVEVARGAYLGWGYAETGADGRYEVAGLPAGSYTMQFLPPYDSPYVGEYWRDAATSATATAITLAAGQRLSADASLARGASVSGRVALLDPTQAVSAGVLAIPADVSNGTYRYAELAADGSYSLVGLPPGTYTLRASAAEHAPQWWDHKDTPESAVPLTVTTGARTGVDFSLGRGSTLSGTVTAGGSRVAGWVTVYDVTRRSRVAQEQTSDGTWNVTGLPPGDYVVEADSSGPGYRTTYYRAAAEWLDATLVRTTAGSTRSGIDFSLLPDAEYAPPPLTGTVSLPAGVPASTYEQLSVEIALPGSDPYQSAPLGADGTFSLSDLPAGGYEVRLRDDSGLGLAIPRTPVTVPATGPLALTAYRAGILTGKVQNAAGKPLSGVLVTVVDAAGVRRGSVTYEGVYRVSGLAAGSARVLVDAASPYVLRWVGGSYAAGTGAAVTVANGQTVSAPTAVVDLGGGLAGRVTVPSGTSDAVVVDALDSAGVVVRSGRFYNGGAWALGGLPAVPLKLRFSAHGLVTQWWRGQPSAATALALTPTPGKTTTGLDVAMAPPPAALPATVSGKITERGVPVADATVVVSAGADGNRYLATTAADGTFTVTGVQPGVYTLNVWDCLAHSGEESNACVNRYWPGVTDASEAVTITVTAGAALTGKNLEMVGGTQSFTSAPVPTVSGTPMVGSTLTGSAGAWSPTPDTLAYQWVVGGVAVPGATGTTYVPVAADQGKTVGLRVTAVKAGYRVTSAVSASVGPVIGLLTAPTPTVSGTAKVGSGLTASPGAWGPAPVTLSYQWFRSGVAISGATASGYTLTGADYAKTITVRVTGAKAGYATVAKTSAATAAVAIGSLTPTPVPTITGTKKVGYRLTATPGAWGPAPVTLSYQWFRSGVAISGATASGYTLTGADYAKTITVRVTGRKTGYTTVTKASLATAAIAIGTLTPTPVPTISGTKRVGYTLTANPGTWGPAPVTLTYQWYRSGVAISGATAKTYRLSSYDRRKTIVVKVTGRKSGYTTVVKASSATSAVL
ncbi:MAG: carboxypeptidase-like regulatory domain-containing protein [Micrococcales bacterium]|nr:carboxypeptidase-like regulatory domain-containing protein [Micrococcales bacterium]